MKEWRYEVPPTLGGVVPVQLEADLVMDGPGGTLKVWNSPAVIRSEVSTGRPVSIRQPDEVYGPGAWIRYFRVKPDPDITVRQTRD